MNAVPDNGRRRGTWQRLGRWAIALIILAFIARSLAVNWDDLAGADLRFSLWPLMASIILVALWLVANALIWHLLTVSVGADIPLRKALPAWFYSQLGKYVPGKVFLYVGRVHLYLKDGRRAGLTTLAFALETICTLAAGIIVGFLAIFTLESQELAPYRWWIVAALAAFLTTLHPRILNGLISVTARLTRRRPFSVDVSYGLIVGYLGLYVLNWALFGAAFFLMIRSFYAIELSAVPFLSGAFAFSSVIGILALFAPSGLGVREGLLSVFLAQVMPLPVALLTAVVSRIWLTVAELVLAGSGLLLKRSGRLADELDAGASRGAGTLGDRGEGTV